MSDFHSFLSDTARYIVEKHPIETLSRISVILPSRRAVHFFKMELATLSDRPFLAPEVLAMDDFMLQKARVTEVDPVALLFELYDTFKQIDPQLDFDRFTSWAPIVLRDFDQIDLYRANSKAVFSWVEAEKAISRWKLEQTSEHQTHVHSYFKLFENLQVVYDRLKARLEEKNQAYRGMAYAKVADEVESIFLDNPTHDFYYFLGFNALSQSEEDTLRKMASLNKAEILWDADAFYLRQNHEAGRFIRKYLQDAELGKGQWNRRYRHFQEYPLDQSVPARLITGAISIQKIGVPNATMQAKVAAHFLRSWEQPVSGDAYQSPQTALILGDENLLTPTLSSIPEGWDDFNVTMGVPLRNSLLFSLVEVIFELQRNVVEFRRKDGNGTVIIPRFSHKHILKILHHPLIQSHWIFNEGNIRGLIRKLKTDNQVFVSEKELLELGGNDPLVRILFTRWNNDSVKATRQLYALIDLLRPQYEDKPDAIETEYLYEFYTILKRLELVLQERSQPVSVKSFRRFLFELFRQTRIPFSGEPVAPLQVMGMLETRCLDFDRVIIMSVNEGVLPTGKKQNSLIPFDAAQEFGLPTYVDADAVMSYHFFRLLQRAKEVILIHTVSGGEGAKSEPSRFLLQLKYELQPLNASLKWIEKTAEFANTEERQSVATELVIPKTPEIRAEILDRLIRKGIFATHLNMYIQCSLQFYFRRIAEVAEDEELQDTLDTNEYGIWVHEVLENIDREMIDRKVRFYEIADYERFIRQIPERLRRVFEQKFSGQVMEEGKNLLLYNVARRNLYNYFQLRIEELKAGNRVEVLAPEQKLTAQMLYQGHPISIGGTIDRLERVNDVIRIVDYKTGKIETKQIDVKANTFPEEMTEQLLTSPDWKILRQLWLYKFLVLKQNHRQVGQVELSSSQVVQPGVFSFRNLSQGFMAQEFLKFRTDETPESFIEDTEKILTEFMDDLFDESKPFRQTTILENCEYCSYARICGR